MDLNQNYLFINQYLFDKGHISEIEVNQTYTANYPVVYILYNLKSKLAYVGESTNVIGRMGNHLANPDKKNLKYVFIISSPYFNKSAALDIESYLIKYMTADNSFSLLNGNAGISEHNYYQKRSYFEIFENIWDNLKLEKVVAKDILDIDNSDLFKYSPYKSLSHDQNKAIFKYLNILSTQQEESCVFIEGCAGTGKTILAVYLIKLLTSTLDIDDIDKSNTEMYEKLKKVDEVKGLHGDLQIALVVPMVSLRKTLKNVFRSVHGLSANMVIGPSDVLKKDYDLLIVDEAHRLKRREGITNYKSFDDANKKLGLGNKGTELDWIRRRSKHQIFFYDDAQSIRPSDIPKETYFELKSESCTIKLTSQMRVNAGVDYIKFIHHLLTKKYSESLKSFENINYDLKLYTNLSDMVKDLESKENLYGLTRMMAGYSWKWVSRTTNTPDAIIDGEEMTWNKEPHDWINSTTEMTEMGCIHTTQGYDLNYGGVIFGHEITYNEETCKIEVIKENYFDSKGKVGVHDINRLHDYIINIYKTLMYRGIKGTYVYCCDKKLESYFKSYIPS